MWVDGRPNGRALLCAVTVVAALGVSACGSSEDGRSTATTSTGAAAKAAGTFTAEDVKTAVKPYDVKPVYDVPKNLPKRYKLAFINPDKANPFFQTWSQGMKAAAKFYGVDFTDVDSATKYDTQTSALTQLLVQQPDVVGAHPGNPVMAKRAKKEGLPFLTIDNAVPGNPNTIGVPDAEVGKMAGDIVGKAAKQRIDDGRWKGKKIVYLGLTATPCDPCDKRIQEGRLSRSPWNFAVAVG